MKFGLQGMMVFCQMFLMKIQRMAEVLGLMVAVVGFSGCAMKPAGGGIKAYREYDRPAKLAKNPSKVIVKVSLSRQRAYVMEGSEALLVMPVSVGKYLESPTPAGNFRIITKEAKRRAHTHGFASNGKEVRRVKLRDKPRGWAFKGTPMPYWCGFYRPEYGFHTGWVKHTPCTNGCIRMHENLAPKFYRLVSVGTPVSIAYRQPEDSLHANIPLPPDAGPLKDYPWEMYLGDGYFSQHKSPVFD